MIRMSTNTNAPCVNTLRISNWSERLYLWRIAIKSVNLFIRSLDKHQTGKVSNKLRAPKILRNAAKGAGSQDADRGTVLPLTVVLPARGEIPTGCSHLLNVTCPGKQRANVLTRLGASLKGIIRPVAPIHPVLVESYSPRTATWLWCNYNADISAIQVAGRNLITPVFSPKYPGAIIVYGDSRRSSQSTQKLGNVATIHLRTHEAIWSDPETRPIHYPVNIFTNWI